MASLEKLGIDGYDWKYAFEYAGGAETDEDERWTGYGYGAPDIRRALPGDKVKLDPFQRKDVVRVSALDEGENDGPAWLCVGKLKDGRWFFLEAGCDYTGWDCQAGGTATVASTKQILLKYGLTDNDKKRLGLK